MTTAGYSSLGAALFIDIENAVAHCSTLGLWLDVKPVCDKIKEIVPLRYRKAFGDIPKTMQSVNMPHKIGEIRKNLSANMIHIQDIPYLTQNKNSADIHLVLDALSLAYDNPHISHFAFMTIDRDFVPLYGKLKELGKTVIVISPDEKFTSEGVLAAADHLYYYERLVNDRSDGFTDIGDNTDTFDLRKLKDRYFDLVIRACESMAMEGLSIKGAALLLRARRLLSDFDYKRAGYAKFKDILKDIEKRGHISIFEPDGEDINIEFLSRESEQKQQSLENLEEHSPEELCKKYKQTLEKALKSPLPSPQYRKIAFAIFEQSYVPGNSLREWFDKALPLIISEATDTQFMDADHSALSFKLLLSLYFSRAFRIEFNPMDKNNPIIHAFSTEPPGFEEFLLRHYARSLRFEGPLDPEALALLFFNEISEEKTSACVRILADLEFA
jgi:uncharacterized LabA/DUF88 family protein